LSQTEALRLIFSAWNLHRDGREIKKLHAPKGGWKASNYPYPH
jgi:hypothetical protein